MFKFHSFMFFLKLWMPLFGMFFAAGGDALGAMGGDSGTAVVLDSTGEGEAEGDGGGEGAEGAAEGADATEGKGAAAAAGDKQPMPDLAKPLSGAAKTALQSVKEANPAAFKEINARLWALNGIDKKISEHFENGLDGAIELKGNLDSFLTEAGARDLQEVRTELNDFRLTDGKIIKGDPSFIGDLPENVQAGLYKMMPDFVRQWSGKDQPGYDRYFAGLVVNTLRDTEFTDNLRTAVREVERMGLDNADVKVVHDLLKGNLEWINKLKTQASAVPEKKDAAAADDKEITTREQAVKQEERRLMIGRIATTFRRQADPKMLKSLAGICGGKIPANVNKAEVMLRAVRNLAESMGEAGNTKIGQYLNARDEAGAIKYQLSQASDQRLADAVEKAYTYIYGKPALGARRAAPAAGKDKTHADGNADGKKDQQFSTIAYNPKASSIDYAKSAELAKKLGLTRNGLFSQNKAVLKSGKAVTWSRDADNEA